MAVPKRRKSKSRTRMGRSHHRLSSVSLIVCSTCGEKTMPHRACPNCGFYKERSVIDVD